VLLVSRTAAVATLRSMRLAIAAVLVALTWPAAAAAATPIGAPAEVRVSRPADERPHPTARTEIWELFAVDPKTRRVLTVRLRRAPLLDTAEVTLGGGGGEPRGADLGQTFQRATGPLVRFSGPGGTTTVSRRRGRISMTLTGSVVTGRLALQRARPGAFARGWSFGPAVRGPEGRQVPTGMSLNVPVATSTLKGRVTVGGETVRLDGWRASLEHVWGSFDLEEGTWAYWDAYTVHTRGGGAWLAFGVNRSETLTGPGARDGQYLGVLTQVSPRGTRVCRPVVHRRRWTSGYFQTPYGRELRARCGGLRVTLRELDDKVFLPGDSSNHYFQDVDHAQASRRGVGTGRHIGFTRR
jgi:hypothetical protein